MLSISELINKFDGETGEALGAVKSGARTSVFGLTKSDARLFCCGLDGFTYVCPDVLSARTAYVELSLHFPTAELLMPKNNVLLAAGAERDGQRLRALYKIASGACNVVVTTAEALMQIVPTRADVLSATTVFSVGKSYKTAELTSALVRAGYTRCGHVDEPSRFAVRGDIVDICTPDGRAARIEFFGYECERIRTLDIVTQTAGVNISEFAAYPATELVSSDKYAAFDALVKLG